MPAIERQKIFAIDMRLHLLDVLYVHDGRAVDAVQRFIVQILLELFQEGLISSDRAAEILGTTTAGFLQILDLHGVGYIDLDACLEEFERRGDVAEAAT